jgi:transposase InsO family protein
MGWKETCPVTERMQFLTDVQSGELSFSEACRRRGISRKTGYKLWTRFQHEGAGALTERSRAPLRHPHAVEAAVVAKLIAARQGHPYWGPRNLIDWLERREPGSRWPAPSTVGELLKRAGLVASRRRRRHSAPYSQPFVAADRPNALWSIDFKGQFRLGDQRYCYPLTVSDGFSRYLLLCRGLSSTKGMPVRRWLERAFCQYGLPVAIRSDNGAPFASVGLGGLTRLSAWWVRLGIVPERIAPGCPAQNGRHERMHRTLAEAIERTPAANLAAEQPCLERFRREYNEERSHQSLARRTPAELYRASTRPYPSRLPPIEYPQRYSVRRVCHSGEFKWNGQFVYVSQVLAGEPVGLEPIGDGQWCVYYGLLPLGTLDARSARAPRIEPLRRELGNA